MPCANERHPESMRTVPWLRPAGGDSVPADPAIELCWPRLFGIFVFQPPPKLTPKSFLLRESCSLDVLKNVNHEEGTAEKCPPRCFHLVNITIFKHNVNIY